MVVTPMTADDAQVICTWRYPAPMDIYNTEDTLETRDSFLDGLHFSVRVAENAPLLAYIAFGPAATLQHPDFMHIYEDETYTDIALGLDPMQIGRGLGTQVFALALELASECFPGDGYRVSVASDNAPALRIYGKMGFEPTHELSAEIVYPDGDNAERTCRKTVLVMAKKFC